MFNDKLLCSSKKVKISIKENKTTCTILSADREFEGTYACKAMSSIGEAITKATLMCHGNISI
jgi:Immunoglobulin I-set domain